MNKYKIITLCGSVKFKEDFLREQLRLSLEENIVLTPVFLENANNTINTETKEMLINLHKRKIDLSDEIFVINKNGYIGTNTKNEIEYAKKTNKKVIYMENI